MTTEEKARAYDEALERARKQRDDYQKEFNKADKSSQLAGILRAGISAIELALPELVESEDERIRKELIEFIQWSEDRGMTRHDFHQAKRPAEWVAWLEKQKESLHISETCKDVIVAIEKYLDWLTGYPDYAPKGKYSIQDMLHCLYIIEKQKEPHYTKRNALFDKCVENCDPEVMKEVSDNVDKMLGCLDSPIMTNEMIMEKQKEQKEITERMQLRRGERRMEMTDCVHFKLGLCMLDHKPCRGNGCCLLKTREEREKHDKGL